MLKSRLNIIKETQTIFKSLFYVSDYYPSEIEHEFVAENKLFCNYKR